MLAGYHATNSPDECSLQKILAAQEYARVKPYAAPFSSQIFFGAGVVFPDSILKQISSHPLSSIYSAKEKSTDLQTNIKKLCLEGTYGEDTLSSVIGRGYLISMENQQDL
jgi:hypothetical protein